jgi:hypothetical protein
LNAPDHVLWCHLPIVPGGCDVRGDGPTGYFTDLEAESDNPATFRASTLTVIDQIVERFSAGNGKT